MKGKSFHRKPKGYTEAHINSSGLMNNIIKTDTEILCTAEYSNYFWANL
jgi:hypothetical protein